MDQPSLHNTPISASAPGTVPIETLIGDPCAAFESDIESFGQRIARLRKAQHWTQADLAIQLGVTEASVCYWEQDRSRPRTARLQALARLLGTPVAGLLGREASEDRASLGDMVARMRAEIAYAAGTTPAKVKIVIEI